MAPVKPFQLLEINIITAQDLEPVFKKMRTYATAWMNPNRKLSSCVDTEGNNNPTWNDKFVFKVDEEFLQRDTSAVMIEIYAKHWLRDVIVGTVRVLVGNLIPPPALSHNQIHNHIGMRFVALQVRRPSGRPQGILNIGVALLDGAMRSMPLYRQLSMSAVGYRDLMADPPSLQQLQHKHNSKDDDHDNKKQPSDSGPMLRRSRSERSDRMLQHMSPSSSILAVSGKTDAKESSILSITDSVVPFRGVKRAGKASSVISGAELREKPKQKGKKGKSGSVVSDSVFSKESSVRKIEAPELKKKDTTVEDNNNKYDEKPGLHKGIDQSKDKAVDKKSVAKAKVKHNVDPIKEKPPAAIIGKPHISKYNGYDYGVPKEPIAQGKCVIGAPLKKGNSLWSDSEVGPSPSEVAAAMAEKKYPLEDNQNSVLDGWSLDESVEGLRSKLERWRMELPPLHDHGFSTSSYKSSGPHKRRLTDNGSGMFSCFGNILGYECQCICGKPPGRKSRGAKFQSPSTITPGRSFP